MHVYPQVACDTSFSSEEIKSKQEFANSFAVGVEASGGAFGATFSASASYNAASNNVRTGESLVIMAHAECRYYKSRLDLVTPPPLTANFYTMVRNLNSASNKTMAAHAFFDTFGTHYATELDFGARYTKQHEMSYSQYDTASESGFSVGVQASYSGLFSVGGGFNLDSEQRQAASDFQKSVKTTTITVGATPPASGDEMEWAANVKLDPLPIRYKLHSIDSLFTTQFMPELSSGEVSMARTVIDAHQGTYCDNLSQRLGLPNNCDISYSGTYGGCNASNDNIRFFYLLTLA